MASLIRLLAMYLPELLLVLACSLLALTPLGPLGWLESLDDLHWLQSAKEMAYGLSGLNPTLNQQAFASAPPALIALMAVFFKLFGAHMAAARGLTLLFSLTALGSTYLLALYWFESRAIALLSAALLLLSWGFFHATQQTPLPMVSLDATLIALTLFWWLMHAAGRRQANRRQALWLSRALGAHLAIASLLGGFPGVVLAVLITLGVLFGQGRLRALGCVQWRQAALAMGLVLLPWGVVAIATGLAPAFLWPLPEAAFPDVLSGAVVASAPWTFLAVGVVWASLRPLFFARGRQGISESTLAVWLWLLLGLLMVPVLPLAFLPPLCIALAQGLAKRLEDASSARAQSWAVDTTVLALMGLAVFWTVSAFQGLPDTFPGVSWPLPGDAMIATPEALAKLALPAAFPAWKLWLLIAPVLVILTGGVYYVFLWLEKPLHGLISLMAGTFVFLLFVNLVAMPVFALPAGVSAAAILNRQRQATLSLSLQSPLWILSPASPAEAPLAMATARLLFSRDPSDSQPLRLTANRHELERALASVRPGGRLLAVMGQSAYYRLPFALRDRVRVLAADAMPVCSPQQVIRPDKAWHCQGMGDARQYLLVLAYEPQASFPAPEALGP